MKRPYGGTTLRSIVGCVNDYGGWRRSHETAYRLRAALLAVGVPTTELNALTARADAAGQPRVVIPPLTLGSVEQLLTALDPYLRTRCVGHSDVSPGAPGSAA